MHHWICHLQKSFLYFPWPKKLCAYTMGKLFHIHTVGPTQQVQNTLSIFHEIYRYCKLLANCYKQMNIAEVNFSLFTCFTAYITCSKSRGPKCHIFRP